ncbi:proline-rich protein 22 [Alligator mississippiensis]|uniref:Proline-rich protein 22 n=1 Tax=Alligator mississippiensis TaxID=8496 RepID=A0A151NW87_ALLMI|nr:proline-rich protein 22 [Alligator mississippiensis]KYO41172.1 proline-rich protein 22 [Alligator mississippiensis]
MQQPKLFYQHQETYGARSLDQADCQANRPLPAFVLPETLTSVGTSNLYQTSSQDKEVLMSPPAGFQMAPCGCFFDPRIYRIEWATTNFVQPSVYKLPSGSNSQTPYLLDAQRYLKSPVQTVPYPHYQQIPSNPQYIMPYFNQEGLTSVTEQVNFVPNPLHDSQLVEVPHLQEEGQIQKSDHKLPQLLITLPGLNQNETPIQVGTLNHLEERLNQTTDPDPSHHLDFQVFDGYQAEGRDLQENHVIQNLLANPQTPDVCMEEQNPLPSTGAEKAQVVPEGTPCPPPDSIAAEERETADAQKSFDLPEKVLLEDAMKLFGCSPANSDSEVPKDNLSRPPEPSKRKRKDCDFPSEDMSSLKLPEELLSCAYSVPEILTTVASLDYFYDIKTNDEEPKWEFGRALPAPQNRASLQDGLQEPQRKKKRSNPSAKKGKHRASKCKASSAQDCCMSQGQDCPMPAV